jgi:outer membrane protein OmpA-like peptidoglycan-associated protein
MLHSTLSAKLASFSGLLVLSGAAYSLSYGKTWELEVNFHAGQSSVSQAERAKLHDLLDKMASEGVCVERVVAIGYTNSKEGSGKRANELSQRRADFVSALLPRSKILPASVYAIGRGLRPDWACAAADNACVSLEFDTKRRGAPSCP